MTTAVETAKINCGVFLVSLTFVILGVAGLMIGLKESVYLLAIFSHIMTGVGVLGLFGLCKDKISVDAVKKREAAMH